MAVASFTILISTLLQIYVINGQHSSLNQGPQSNQAVTQDNSIQNQIGNSANKATILSAQVPVNFQSLTPQSTISTQSTLSLQNPQSAVQPITMKIAQIPNFQQAFTIQPSLKFDASFLQQQLQQSSDSQKPQNLQQSQNVYNIPLIQQIPCAKQSNLQPSINVGELNTNQQLPITSPVLPQAPVKTSQSDIPRALFVSSPSLTTVPNCACKNTAKTNNLGVYYVPPSVGTYPVKETPQTTPFFPVSAVLSTPSPTPLVIHSLQPYANQFPDIMQSPLRISNDFLIEDETKSLNQDSLTSLLLSLLQSPKESSRSSILSGYAGNSYLSSYLNQGSKSSSLKSLLPLILNILNERREGCGCCTGCQNCEHKRINKEDTEPRIYEGQTTKKDYSLREEMFQKDEADIPRVVRDHKRLKKLKNYVPNNNSCEDEDTEYSDCSEEDED